MFQVSDYKNRELTLALNKAPYKPTFLSKMGLFRAKPTYRTSVFIEERHGKLSLVETAERGSRQGQQNTAPKRSGKHFEIPHLPHYAIIRPDDLPDVRRFNTIDGKRMVNEVVREFLADMRQDIEVTLEYHRMGAIHGHVKDADGSTIYNLFTEFGVVEKSININFTTPDAVKLKVAEARRHIEDSLGADSSMITGLVVFCGDTFYDTLIDLAEVKDAYDRPKEGLFLREDHTRGAFEFAGVTWMNYRGSVGTVDFIAATEARMIPTGVPNLFIQRNGPGDTMESVGRLGKEYFVTKEVLPHDGGVELRGQANPLILCTRPAALVKFTGTYS